MDNKVTGTDCSVSIYLFLFWLLVDVEMEMLPNFYNGILTFNFYYLHISSGILITFNLLDVCHSLSMSRLVFNFIFLFFISVVQRKGNLLYL